MGLILLILILVLLILTLPRWPYSASWGYQPSSILGIILLVVLILIIANVISFWKVDIHEGKNKTTIKIERKD